MTKIIVPKQWCKQSIGLLIYDKNTDEYGDYTNSKTTIINNIIAQLSTSFSGSNNDRMTNALGTFFLYNGISTPFPQLEPTTHGEVIFNGVTYSISAININLYPESNKIFSYEIEVNSIAN